MVAIGKGLWIKELTLAVGIYEYRIVVDGEWMSDPSAKETINNPYGGVNSVIRITGKTGCFPMADDSVMTKITAWIPEDY